MGGKVPQSHNPTTSRTSEQHLETVCTHDICHYKTASLDLRVPNTWHLYPSRWQMYGLNPGVMPRRIQFRMKFSHCNTVDTAAVGLLLGFVCYRSLIAGQLEPAATFRCLSLTPSSVRGQSPAEGQMVSFLPLGPRLTCHSVAVFPPAGSV